MVNQVENIKILPQLHTEFNSTLIMLFGNQKFYFEKYSYIFIQTISRLREILHLALMIKEKKLTYPCMRKISVNN